MCNNARTRIHSRKPLPLLSRIHRVQFSEASSTPSEDPSEQSILPPENEETIMSEEELMKKRDISRLTPERRAIVHNKPLPFNCDGSKYKFQQSLAFQRHLYGKYGSGIGVDPAVCFMTKEEMDDFREYEKVASPEHILEVRKRKLEELAEEKRQYRIREEHYDKMMASMEEHKKKIREKILSKIADAEEAKRKRDALLEEVKRHFGYTIDPKDEKFQLMLEQKEKEQKKLRKELKKKKREEFFMAKLASLESGPENPSDKQTKASKQENAARDDDEKDSDDENEKEK